MKNRQNIKKYRSEGEDGGKPHDNAYPRGNPASLADLADLADLQSSVYCCGTPPPFTTRSNSIFDFGNKPLHKHAKFGNVKRQQLLRFYRTAWSNYFDSRAILQKRDTRGRGPLLIK